MAIAWDNFAEYRDPERYDAEWGAWLPDGPFYEGVAAATGGPVLDVGCGTGRIAIVLARRGLDVVGIDMAPEMLRHAEAKSRGLPVTWIEADARALDLGRRFRCAIMAANAFQHLTSAADQEAAAHAIARHLEPDGAFAFNARNPGAHEDVRDAPEETPWEGFTDEHGRWVGVSGTTAWNPADATLTYTIIRRVAGAEDRRKLLLRAAPVGWIVAMLRRAGFPEVDVFGGFGREPFDETTSQDAVFLARR
jgi:SAM-dependent methyltransferase